MIKILKNNWFMLALVATPLTALLDTAGLTVPSGLWLKNHFGPDMVIILIFFCSGLSLESRHLRSGIGDYQATLVALALIFIVSPALAFLLGQAPLPMEIAIGLFLVAVMPCTLNSGVVMTGAAGGNMAHALVITILANSLAVITIPFVLETLLHLAGDSRTVHIDQLPVMVKIATRVLLPLFLGLLARNHFSKQLQPLLPHTTLCNQLGILLMIWMAMCQGRTTVITNLAALVLIVTLVFTFHLLLISTAWFACRFFGIGKGRRESVILTGGQKTLPLSVILQVSLFPEYGLTLVVCIMHHMVHLIIDAWLLNQLKRID